ncbi:MAG: tetratricopeptide repeat protein [Planctomycetota bacterium]|jgi:tetratricopeptide (TPR) repeat protein
MKRILSYGLGCGLLIVITSGCNLKARRLRDKGIAEFQIGRIDNARALLKQSVDLNASDPDALYYMGRVMHADKFYEQAVYYYRSCLQAKPSHLSAREWLAKAMAALGSEEKGPVATPQEQRAGEY